MRKKMIAGNWKMNKTTRDAIELANGIKRDLSQATDISIVVCPPYTALDEVSEVLYESNILLGAQNMHWEDSGAFTGEVSNSMLKELNCTFVILGHSERRQFFGDNDEIVNHKVKAAFEFGLTPILCVGESLAENESGKAKTVITTQVKAALAGVTSTDKLVVAYEPIWAIGTGRAATGGSANETIAFIRQRVSEMRDAETAKGMRILYGGSVTAANIAEFVRQPDIDGALVGGASLKAAEFVSIVSQTARVRSRS